MNWLMRTVMLKESDPVRFGVLAAPVPEQRFLRRECQNLRDRDFILAPLEDEHALMLEHAEALGEAFAQHLAPVAGECAVFQTDPALGSVALEVRRVEANQREALIREWQRSEVGHDVRRDDQRPLPALAGFVGQFMRFASAVYEDRSRVCAVEPEHAASAAGVEHRRQNQVPRANRRGRHVFDRFHRELSSWVFCRACGSCTVLAPEMIPEVLFDYVLEVQFFIPFVVSMFATQRSQ